MVPSRTGTVASNWGRKAPEREQFSQVDGARVVSEEEKKRSSSTTFFLCGERRDFVSILLSFSLLLFSLSLHFRAPLRLEPRDTGALSSLPSALPDSSREQQEASPPAASRQREAVRERNEKESFSSLLSPLSLSPLLLLPLLPACLFPREGLPETRPRPRRTKAAMYIKQVRKKRASMLSTSTISK